ncbi:MAG: DUF2341 domain-containing protein [Candidatus Diapherotrites archaeon]
MGPQNIQRTSQILLLLALATAFLPAYCFAQLCTGGLGITGAQDCIGTNTVPCHNCDSSDMDFEIRAPDDTNTTGWVNETYSGAVGTCPSACSEETWLNSYGYTFCHAEGAYDARTRSYSQDGGTYDWETSDWNIGVYTVNWDALQNWCTCKTGSSANWFSTVSGGSNGQCCGDDAASDDFYYYTASPTTASTLDCTRCSNGTKAGPTTLYGNGKWSGTDKTTDTSGTCYSGDITCNDTTASNGTSGTYYGNGYWSGASPLTDTSGTCYYGDITCSDGSAANGTSGTYYGNGYTTANSTTDKNGLCRYGDITCSNGSAANGASNYIYGNGSAFGTTCHYGDWTCANGSDSNGASCTLACSGLGTACCTSQSNYRDTITCAESGCGQTDHERDTGQSYCTATASGCTAYIWDSLGSKCCGDDGSGDSFCTTGGGSCMSGTWNANHCLDGVKNCTEVGIDTGGTDCNLAATDMAAPTTTSDANTAWQTSNQTITLTCSDGSAVGATGCQATYYCIDDYNTCLPSIAGTTVQVNCASNDVNRKFVRFYSLDYNSNVEAVKSAYIRIDKQKPSTDNNISTSWVDANVHVKFSCTDYNGSGCYLTQYRQDTNPSKELTWGAWATYTGAIIFGSDGNYAVDFNSKDAVGNIESTIRMLVKIDKGIALIWPMETYSYYSTYDGNVIVQFTQDGNHQLDFNSRDVAGNVEQVRTVWVAIDKSPPVTVDDLNAAWHTVNFSVTLTCRDAAKQCTLTKYRIDSDATSSVSIGAWNTYSTPISISTDGNWAIDYNSTDYVGWIEATHTIYALLDKNAPTTTDDANTAWRNSNLAVTLTATDSTSGVKDTLFCQTTGSCTPSVSGNNFTISCPSEAVCTEYLYYRSIDIAGNQESIKNTGEIKIDKQSPIVSDDANSACQFSDQTVNIESYDWNGSGILGTYYCVDDSNSCEPSTSGSSASVTCDANSTCQKYVRYNAVDLAGNASSMHAPKLIIDKGASTTTDDANTQWQGSNQTILLTPSDGGGCGVSATYYCIDTSNTCTPTTNGTSVSVDCNANSVCQKYVRYYSIDSGGNTETVKSVLIKIDRQPPTTQHDANTAWQNSNQIVHFTVNDSSGCGGDSAYYCLDDANTCSPNILSSSADVNCDTNYVCQKYVRFKGVDYAGNQDVVRAVLIRIDKNAPMTASDINTAWRSTDHVIYLTRHDTGSGIQNTWFCTDSDNTCTPNIADTSFTVYAIDDQISRPYVRYYSKDNVNNAEGIHSERVSMDRQKPTTTDDSNTAWQKTDVTVHLSPSDGSGCGVYATYYCVDTAGTCTPTTSGTSANVTCDVNSVCQKYVRYYSVDNVNNTETVKTSNLVKIDKNAPYTTDNAPSAWQAQDVNVTLSPSDGSGSGVASTKYCVDTAGTCTPTSTYAAPVSVTCASDSICQQYVRYYSTDNAGNAEPIRTSVLVKIDKQAPTTTDNASPDWQSADVNVTLTPSDGSGSGIAATYYCIDDANSCTPDTSGTTASVTCPANSVCQKYVRYRSIDNVGNQEITKAALVKIEKREPHTSTNITQTWYAGDFNVELTCTPASQYTTCVQTTYRLNSGSWTVYSAPFTVTASGINTIDFNSRDSAGNIEDINTDYVRIDRTAPNTTNDANTLWKSTDLQFTLSPTDSQSGVSATYYCIDTANTCTPTTSGTSVSVTCDVNQNCQKYVRYYSKDAMDNTESVKNVLVRIDKRYPYTLAEAPSGCVNLDFNILLTCIDESGSGRCMIQYKWGEEQWLSSGTLTATESFTWWDMNWGRRKKIVFNNAGQSAKNDYSILLRLNSGNFHFFETQSDGRDLRFIDDDNSTQLDYFIDTFSRSQQDAVIWVKVPQINAGSTTDHIWMYYSNSRADANQSANWYG